MKILKFILLSALISTTLFVEVSAQLTNTKEPTVCAEKVPVLQIFSIKDNHVRFNESGFESYDEVDLLMRRTDDDNIPWEAVPYRPGDITNVPQTGRLEEVTLTKCEEYIFKIKLVCNGITSYSKSVTQKFEDESCH